jgi:hypothetical protein
MSNRFHGRQGKGAKRSDRLAKRQEAEARNALTLPERRKSARRQASK